MLVLVGLFFVSCKEQMDSNRDRGVEEILNAGDWKLVDSEKEFTRFQNGLKFAEDNQIFNIDSQGQVVVPMQERLYTVSGDTLTFVDYRYEERFIFSRGTDILLIEELTKDRMVLNVIHPEGPNRLIFENYR